VQPCETRGYVTIKDPSGVGQQPRPTPTVDVSDATLKPIVIKQSAGLLVYREADTGIEIFLVHPGGPFFKKKDDGVWSIPKGEFDDEDSLAAARREFLSVRSTRRYR